RTAYPGGVFGRTGQARLRRADGRWPGDDRHAPVSSARAVRQRTARSHLPGRLPGRPTKVACGSRSTTLTMTDVTHLLAAIVGGDPHAAAQLLPLIYDELRRLAAQRLVQEKPGQ